MTPNKSLYQALPHEVEWVEFKGNQANLKAIAEWIHYSCYLYIQYDGEGWMYRTVSDHGTSNWEVIPFGSLVCRNVANDFHYIILPEKKEEFLERLTVIK